MLHHTQAARQFVESGFPGISASVIWEEKGNGSNFVKFKAGATFPLHDHEGPEEILMLSGRIRFGRPRIVNGRLFEDRMGRRKRCQEQFHVCR